MSQHVSRIASDRLYVIYEEDGSFSYGVSPDGEGVYWYDTCAEAYEQHGVIPTTAISAEDFDTLRFGPRFDFIDADIEFEEYGEW